MVKLYGEYHPCPVCGANLPRNSSKCIYYHEPNQKYIDRSEIYDTDIEIEYTHSDGFNCDDLE
ncbi:MAG: hypothetical protein M0R51_08205 [Clostridia bacterium]|jgi:deoxycytidylate deaminase|nr:hypothetical protein [Clostridia bacterium]